MIDLTGRLAAAVRDEIEAEMSLVHAELIGGTVPNMERYKLLMGKIEGLRIAARSVETALKKMRTIDDE